MILSLEWSRKLTVSFVLIIAAVTVIDTTIVGFVAFSNMELPTMYYLLLFVGMFVLFSICGLILFNATNKNTSESPKRSRTKLRWMAIVMFGSLVYHNRNFPFPDFSNVSIEQLSDYFYRYSSLYRTFIGTSIP